MRSPLGRRLHLVQRARWARPVPHLKARRHQPLRASRAPRHGCRAAAAVRPEDQTPPSDDTALPAIRPKNDEQSPRRRPLTKRHNAKDPGDDLFSRGAAP